MLSGAHVTIEIRIQRNDHTKSSCFSGPAPVLPWEGKTPYEHSHFVIKTYIFDTNYTILSPGNVDTSRLNREENSSNNLAENIHKFLQRVFFLTEDLAMLGGTYGGLP